MSTASEPHAGNKAALDWVQVDEVAQAIWGADRCANHRCNRRAWCGWESLGERQKETYRRMAQAAMDALSAASAG